MIVLRHSGGCLTLVVVCKLFWGVFHETPGKAVRRSGEGLGLHWFVGAEGLKRPWPLIKTMINLRANCRAAVQPDAEHLSTGQTSTVPPKKCDTLVLFKEDQSCATFL